MKVKKKRKQKLTGCGMWSSMQLVVVDKQILLLCCDCTNMTRFPSLNACHTVVDLNTCGYPQVTCMHTGNTLKTC